MRKRILVVASACATAVTLAHAQAPTDLANVQHRLQVLETSEAEVLANLQAVQRELADIKALLESMRASRPANTAPALPVQPLSIEGSERRGSAGAKVVVIEYSDFECPYCGSFARDTWPALEKAYVEPGQVSMAFRELPLEGLHPHAFRAAEGAECASRQGMFWPMHDQLFQRQKSLDEGVVFESAKLIGLDPEAFKTCMSGPGAVKVRQDMDGARALQITGTPTFFVGLVQPDGRVKVTRRLAGSQPFAVFKGVLDPLLVQSAVSK
jgi:protein-disulfide isomerase